jgi:hypothetical protein
MNLAPTAAVAGAFIISERAALPFNFGDKVRLVRGQQRPEIKDGEIGMVSEIEEYPILMGPVPRIRSEISSRAGLAPAWSAPSRGRKIGNCLPIDVRTAADLWPLQ